MQKLHALYNNVYLKTKTKQKPVSLVLTIHIISKDSYLLLKTCKFLRILGNVKVLWCVGDLITMPFFFPSSNEIIISRKRSYRNVRMRTRFKLYKIMSGL